MKYLDCIASLDKNSFCEDELYEELLSVESEYEKVCYEEDLLKQAKLCDSLSKFKARLSALKRDLKNEKALKNTAVELKNDNVTDFTGEQQLACGIWTANDSGIAVYSEKGIIEACKHPIYPTRILINAETNLCKIELRYKVRGQWRTCIEEKEIISSASKILTLANKGVQVNSENARNLVKYLADVEALNEYDITEVVSTSRFGWINEKCFMPYGNNIIFDNEQNLKSLFESIKSVGSRDEWYDMIKKLRAKKQFEFLIYMAASFASVLVEPCGALPFVVAMYGGSGCGKTVTMMIATSVWADPAEGKYITGSKGTSTAAEIRLSTLNNLPLMVDDLAQIQAQYDGDFSSLIYDWCNGKSKDRSNKALGLNSIGSWRNAILVNSEHSILNESIQGGAANRVIDVEVAEKMLVNNEGNEYAEFVKKNYGYAGHDFVNLILNIGFDEVKKIQKHYSEVIRDMSADDEKEEKQILPMSIILTADELIEKYLFKDEIRIDIAKSVSMLRSVNSDNEQQRAYDCICDICMINNYRFRDDEKERWGSKELIDGHCTGKRAYNILHNELGDMVELMHVGMRLKVD